MQTDISAESVPSLITALSRMPQRDMSVLQASYAMLRVSEGTAQANELSRSVCAGSPFLKLVKFAVEIMGQQEIF